MAAGHVVLPVAAAEDEDVVAVAAVQVVVAGAADEGVGPLLAVEGVVALFAIQRVVAAAAGQGVVARAAVHLVGGVGAGDVVVGRGAGQQRCHDVADVPFGAVVEADLLDAVVGIGRVVVVEETVDADLVGRADDAQLQRLVAAPVVVVGLLQAHVRRRDAGLELQRVDARLAAVVVVVQPVLAVTAAEQEGVAARARVERVVAGTAFEQVVAVAALQRVIAGIAVEPVNAVATAERVVAVPALQQVQAIAAADAVVAGAAGHHVVAVVAGQVVIARAAVDDVVAGRAGDGVVAQPAAQGLGRERAAHVVVAVGEGLHHRHQRGDIPLGAVVEAHPLDAVVAVGRVVVVEEAVDADLVGAADEAELQRLVAAPVVVVGLPDPHVRWRDTGLELQRVDARLAAVVVVVQPVLPVAATEQEGVAARARVERVVASTAVQRVVAGAAVQRVVAVVALKYVLAVAAVQRIVAGTADDGVVALLAGQAVVAGAAVDDVVAARAGNGVVAQAAAEALGGVGAAPVVVTVGAGVQPCQQGCDVPFGAVVETDLLQAVVGIGRIVVVEEAVDADLVGAADDAELQRLVAAPVVVVGLLQAHVRRRDAGLELQRVDARLAAVVVVVQPVLPVAAAEQEGVVARARVERVVAGAAFEQVVAVAAIQRVVALVALQAVRTGLAGQAVVAGAARDDIVAAGTVEAVVAAAAADDVGRRRAAHVVVAAGAREQHAHQRGGIPFGAVREAHALQAVVGVGGVVAIEEAVDDDLVGRAGDAQLQRAVAAEVVVVGLAHDHVARRDAVLEDQHVGAHLAAVVVVVQPVLAIAAAEHEGVAAGARIEGVVAQAAFQRVVAVAAVQAVVALAAEQLVRPRFAVQAVVAAAARDEVVAGRAVERVVALPAAETVGRIGAAQVVVARRAGQQHRDELVGRPLGAVGKAHALDAGVGVGGVVVVEEAVDDDLVGRAGDRQLQRAVAAEVVVVDLPQHEVRRQHAGLELQRVDAGLAAVVVVVQPVGAVAAAEQEAVAARAGVERVVAAAAVQQVVAAAAVQAVVAGAAVQAVVAAGAVERVIAGAAIEQVGPGTAAEVVVAGRAHAQQEQQVRDVPDRAVGERDLLQAVELVGRRAAVQEAVEGDDVAGAADGQRQRHVAAGLVVVGARHRHVGGRHAGLELQRVDLAEVGVEVGLHGGRAITAAEQVEVIARAVADDRAGLGGAGRQRLALRLLLDQAGQFSGAPGAAVGEGHRLHRVGFGEEAADLHAVGAAPQGQLQRGGLAAGVVHDPAQRHVGRRDARAQLQRARRLVAGGAGIDPGRPVALREGVDLGRGRFALRRQQVHAGHGVGRQQQLGLQRLDLPGLGLARLNAGGRVLGSTAQSGRRTGAQGLDRHGWKPRKRSISLFRVSSGYIRQATLPPGRWPRDSGLPPVTDLLFFTCKRGGRVRLGCPLALGGKRP